MPKLGLPICLKSELTQYHRVIKYLSIPEENKPIRFLTPCLSQTVGHVTCMELVRKPILSEMDGCQNCVLSIHNDNRVRIWDLEDGRCVNISSHSPFECTTINICRPLTHNYNRFFVVAGQGKTIEVLDVWKLRSIFSFKIDDKSSSVRDIKIVFEKKQMYCVDNKNIVYCFDISDYSSEELSVYSAFVSSQKELNKRVKDAKCKLIKKMKLTSSKQQLIEMHIQQNLSLISFVYPTKIIFQSTEEFYTVMHEKKEQPKEPAASSSAPTTQQPAAGAAAPMNSMMSNAQQQQLMMMIQRSQEIMQSGSAAMPSISSSQFQPQVAPVAQPAAPPAPLTKLKKKISFKMMSTQAENPQMWMNATELIYENELPHLLIFYRNGSSSVMSLADIEKLAEFNQVCIAHDFTFDFASFSYSKLENSLKGSLTMQLVEILQAKGTSVPQDYVDFGQRYDLLGYEQKHRYLLEFIPDKSIMYAHPLSEHLAKIRSNISQIKYFRQAGQELESPHDQENTINYLDLKIIFTPDSLQGSMYKRIDFQRLLLSSPTELQMSSLVSEATRLCDNERIFNSMFYVKYGSYFEERFGEERISISSMNFVDSNNPYYFFGTESGKVIGIPLLFSDDKESFDILLYQLEPRKAITFLEYRKGFLIVSSESSSTSILALSDSIHLLKPTAPTKERLNIIDLQPCVKQVEVFSSPVKRVMKMKILQSIKKDLQFQDVVKEAEKYLKHTICFILENNSVMVYNSKTHTTEFKLNSNKGSIYGLYFNPVSDYFITLTNEGRINFWSMGSMRFEKSGKFQQYMGLFDLESLIEERFQKVQKGRNEISVFKEINSMSISHVHSILEFNQRFFDDTVNYSDESSSKGQTSHLMYEQLGELRDTKHTPEQQLTLLWMIQVSQANKCGQFIEDLQRILLQQLKPTIYQSQNRENGMSILRLKLNRVNKQTFHNQAFILFVDFKKHNQQIVDKFENSHHPEDHQIFSYVPFVYPWGDQVKKADLSVANLINHKRPVFNYVVGCAGMGQCFSFSLEKASQYSTSGYLSSIQALSIILHLMNIGNFKDNALTYNVMLDVANNFTKYKKRVHPKFKSLSLPILARYCVDDSNEVMSSASNLIINYLVQQDEDNSKYMKLAVQLFGLNLEQQREREATLSISEITWLFIITYTNIFSSNQVGDVTQSLVEQGYGLSNSLLTQMTQYIKRIVQVVELKNCLANPNLVAPCMKILTEGINLWKDMIENYKELMSNLIFIYFHYNTSMEQLDALRDIPKPQLKRAVYLDLFLKQPANTRKRMKLMTIKTIISLVSVCQNEFLMLVNREIVNIDRHPLYPCSIIDIMRNYIKVQTSNAATKLPIFIEIILKSLDPNNPQFRKICHGPASKALLAIFQFFPNISYHQQSQKFAVGTSQNQIFIYDLRTAVKWRVLQGHAGAVASLSFDNSGKHIASFSTEDFYLRMWKVGSTGFFSSILNMNGSPTKSVAIPREQFEAAATQPNAKITIQWDQSDKKLQINFGSLNYRVNFG